MSTGDTPRHGTRLTAVTTAALRHRRLFFGTAGFVFAASVALVVLTGPRYSAESAFLPHIGPHARSSAPIRLTDLGGRFGVQLAWSEAAEGPQFYADLVTSRSILRDAALTTYRFPTGWAAPDSLAGNLPQLLDISGETRAERVHTAVRWLERRVEGRMDRTTGIVTVRAGAPWPHLAAQLNARLLELVEGFITEKRQERGGLMREFAAERVTEAQRDLRQAEARLEAFLAANRAYTQSPRLQLQAARLEREIVRRQDVYVSLVLAHEEARMEEARNTPFITVLDSPTVPVKPDGLDLFVIGLIGLAVGAALGALLAFTADRLTHETGLRLLEGRRAAA